MNLSTALPAPAPWAYSGRAQGQGLSSVLRRREVGLAELDKMQQKGAMDALGSALSACDPEGSVHALVAALESGATFDQVETTLLRAIASSGDGLHGYVYASAAFELAAALGPEVGRYPLAAATLKVARLPNDNGVARLVRAQQVELGPRRPAVGIGEVERALAAALDEQRAAAAVQQALALYRMSGEGAYPIETMAKWAATPQAIKEPQGYVSHFPLLIDAALSMLRVATKQDDVDLVLGHLVHGLLDLARKYTVERVAAAPIPAVDAAEAVGLLRAAIHGRKLEELHGLVEAASRPRRSIDEAARALMRCALESEEGLSHRFTLAASAWRSARRLHPAVGRGLLVHAAISIANGYSGPRRLLEVRDLPHPNPGGRDYPGRLLLGLASGNVAEAHAALRGLFEAGTSPRTAALPFLDAASQLDAQDLHTDHALIITQAAWRAVSDGSFGGEPVPLLAELAARIAKAPKDHEIIALVEDARGKDASARA